MRDQFTLLALLGMPKLLFIKKGRLTMPLLTVKNKLVMLKTLTLIALVME